ncbi:spindle pole body component 110-like isoform X2 [Momordica charantia]|uniref:Spindle pole body component 110-like isoform X2 n=1 Tax=Momordica charantia TaxID=3673 RepID=A0A6J1C657_MOMCH|nr:spindle pole body component 110-like isoform X2 [Momordica charantia]
MATEPHSVAAALSCIDEDDLETRSISELVSFLRTAFRNIDFDKVEEVLVAKEVKLKKEIENKNKECELIQTKYEFLRLDNLTQECTLQQQVKVDSKEFDKWKETYEELKERESEIINLKQLVFKVNQNREETKSALEQSEKLLEVVQKTREDDKKIIEELKCENSELESSKRAIEVAYEQCQKKYEELVRRVSQLEDSYAKLNNGEPVAPNRNDTKSGACSDGSKKFVRKKGAESDKIENRTGTGGCIVEIISDDENASVENLFRPRGNPKRKLGSFLDDCEVYSAERDDEEIIILPGGSKGKKVGASSTTPHHCHPAKHVLKKLLSSGTNDSKKVVTSPRSAPVMLRQCTEKVGAECKLHNSKLKHATYCRDYSSEDWSISSDSDGDTQNGYGSSHLNSKDQGKICNKQWELQAEMLAAFNESDVLCMEAVCILYRQKNLTAKPHGADLPSRHRGFNEADMLSFLQGYHIGVVSYQWRSTREIKEIYNRIETVRRQWSC